MSAGRRGLAPRLFAAIVLVVLVGSVTAWAVAVAIGPAIFHDHMITARAADPAVVAHAEEAFRTSAALVLAVALATAMVSSVVVSVVLTRRIGRSLTPVTAAARAVAAGDHDARVPAVGMGSEFDELAGAFNAMAADLGRVEAGRTRMLGDLAHEMRTPVATLDAYLEAIGDGMAEADERTVAMLRTQTARLARLAEDVALVTTAEEGRLPLRRTPVPVAGLLDAAAAEAAARYAERGVDLAVEADPVVGRALVDADPDRIGQVLTNLLDNALRHTPAGGHVVLGAARAGGRVRLSVADDGAGVPPEHLPRLFDRFYRADAARDRAHGGSGVGLAVVRAIVEAHDGTVTAASGGPGRGATFTVELALASSGRP